MSDAVTPPEPTPVGPAAPGSATGVEPTATVVSGVTADGVPVVAFGAASGDDRVSIAATTDGDLDLVVAEATDGDTSVAGALLSDGAWSLLVADFSEKHLALEAYSELRQAADANRLRIEGAFVLAKDQNGELTIDQATDLRTRRGLRWGLVTGAIVGLLFPPSLLAGLAVGGAVGAGVGRLRHNQVAGELAEELSAAVEPGHSGLMMLVSDPAMVELQKALAKADRIVQRAVDRAVVEEITSRVDAAEQAKPTSEPDD
ncbi:MAG: DUF1269 domain-containing protein [Propionicimonas sp.]|uniref:DUF1269 domain-containing protein n=1 Tax=Propionicimonas sp. TaxID=1955623 RepID=UPI003D12E97F